MSSSEPSQNSNGHDASGVTGAREQWERDLLNPAIQKFPERRETFSSLTRSTLQIPPVTGKRILTTPNLLLVWHQKCWTKSVCVAGSSLSTTTVVKVKHRN